MSSIYLSLLMTGATISALGVGPAPNYVLEAIPEGYQLQEYDDCGVAGRQPHVNMTGSYLYTFNPSDCAGTPNERSAVFNYTAVQAVYSNLNPALSYVLALTYPNDRVYKRVQSLEANGIELHGPCPLPLAKATRVIVRVPPEVSREGKMALTWKRLGEANAAVSIIELWANEAPGNSLRFGFLTGLAQSLEGQAMDLTYRGLPGAEVTLSAPGASGVLMATAGKEGTFSFSRSEMEALSPAGKWTLTIRHRGDQAGTNLNAVNLFFEPVHYRPRPVRTAGLKTNTISLDGDWRINPVPGLDIRHTPLNGPGWSGIKVPGQWLQQGYDVPKDRTVAMAKEFTVPKNWSGHRVILRFDAVHAGTTYWLNGRKLGYSENLFTPVEWDITDSVAPGGINRLDMEMKVDTLSETYSISSKYAFHNLGGIDRAVRVFALSPTHISQLHLDAGLDNEFRDGELRLCAVVEGGAAPEKDLELSIELRDSRGAVVQPSVSRLAIEPFTGSKAVEIKAQVARPLPWSAEKPSLYKLAIELRQHGRTLERIERNVGFRTLEIRGRQLYLNGRVVKLAGSLHHEIDPLTGRANTAVHSAEDVRLLKEANLNHIRTIHYPPNAELLDAADRLGMYVEVEAPVCWNGEATHDTAHKEAVLRPVCAMIDYDHSHPSVILWSVANESYFNLEFFYSAKTCHQLDPTRPTTFENPDQEGTPCGGVTDIANHHYTPWPYDQGYESDPRPILMGEYYFEITHEQTDVAVDPGLRELWGFGHAEPESAFGMALTKEYDRPGGEDPEPLLRPGGWSFIELSDHVIGGSICGSIDEAFYFSETNHAGYAWHHGFWGLIDAWRRPKPEWFLCRHVFSPVWLETRHVEFAPGVKSVRVPVENRYAFTDFSELKFSWQINGHKGELDPRLAPGGKGELEIPVPDGTAEGSHILLRVTKPSGVLVDDMFVWLGHEKSEVLPKASVGAPKWSDDGRRIFIQGDGFNAVFDREKGDFDDGDTRHTCAVISFPTVHATRYDSGDLGASSYAALPGHESRVFEKIEVQEEGAGLRLTVHDHYQDFAGSTSWLMDKTGHGLVSCDYTYSGDPIDTREAGIRFLLKPACDEVKWRRWSEWGGTFPPESITRIEGTARAHRPAQWGPARWNERPSWPWSLDETELGTADFRSVKYNVYDAALLAADASGLELCANADAHFRAALAPGGVAAHLLSRCPFRETALSKGDRLRSEFAVRLRGHS
jgi:hypothetical protein